MKKTYITPDADIILISIKDDILHISLSEGTTGGETVDFGGDGWLTDN